MTSRLLWVKSGLILSIIILAAYLRFHNLEKMFVFTVDEEYHVALATNLISHFHLKLIGVSISTGFYLGPLWTYLTALLLYFSHSLYSLAYTAAGLGVLTTFFVFITGCELFNFWVGLLASLLYSCLPLIVYFDQKYWNDTPIPLLTLGMVLSISKSQNNKWWYVLFALLLGLLFHTHLSPILIGLFGLGLFIKQINQIPSKIIITSALIFFILISPLVLFDLTHHFQNITSPFKLTHTFHSGITFNPSNHLLILFQTLGRFWYLNPGSSNADENNWGCTSLSLPEIPSYIDKYSTRTTPLIGISLLSLIVFLFFLINPKTWRNFNSKLVAVSTVFIIVPFVFFPGGGLEYYLLGTFPLLCLIFTKVFIDIKITEKALPIFILIIVAFSFYTISQVNTEFGMANKISIVKSVSNIVGKKSFYLSSDVGCQQYGGWREIFAYYGKLPSASYTDSNLGWLYPNEIKKGPFFFDVVITEKRMKTKITGKKIMTIGKGGYKVFIISKNI